MIMYRELSAIRMLSEQAHAFASCRIYTVTAEYESVICGFYETLCLCRNGKRQCTQPIAVRLELFDPENQVKNIWCYC